MIHVHIYRNMNIGYNAMKQRFYTGREKPSRGNWMKLYGNREESSDKPSLKYWNEHYLHAKELQRKREIQPT